MALRIIIIIVVILILIQFIRPQTNAHPGPQPNAITTAYAVPDTVLHVMQRACYDCHSNNTKYPWYNNFQPVRRWLNHHVNEGKRELNFDEFATYTAKRKAHKMEEVAKSVKEGDMPLNSYTWVHTESRLSDAEKQLIINWADSLKAQIQP